MANVIETVSNLMKNLVSEPTHPTTPLHVGEVMSLWTYLASLEGAVAVEHMAMNTSIDKELRELLKEAIDLCTKQVHTLKQFLVNEGIPLPPVTPNKPYSDPSAVPYGVKSTDDELANTLSLKTAASIIECATGMAQSIRTDVGMMWSGFLIDHMSFGARIKEMMLRRGWLKVPPYYLAPGLPNKQPRARE